MKIKIEIPKIHCARTTNEIFKDEIYYGIIAMAGRLENGQFILSSQSPVFGKVSEIKKDVKKGVTWRPTVNDHEFDVDDDTEVIAISTVLYEEDGGGIYNQIKQEFNEIVIPDKFNWSVIIDAVKDVILKDVNENGETDFEDILSAITTKPTLTPLIIGGFLFKTIKTVVKFLRQDDLLGSVTDQFELSKEGFDLPREYDFRRHKGKYRLGLKVSKV